QVPETRPAPTQELTIDRVAFAMFLRQIAPRRAGARHPEDAVQRPPVIRWRAATQRTAGNNERLEKPPFHIAHQSANQRHLPLEAVLNHTIASLRIPLSTRPSPGEGNRPSAPSENA